jgi:MoaA/NifB/PqqE/SkfB family radical SAM enzyme
MGKSIRLNVENIGRFLTQPPEAYADVRFDSNNDCNVHCVYCHNPRTKETVEQAQLERFLRDCVTAVEHFQFGCVMEPTLDPRMCDLMLAVSRSRGQPTRMFTLQTNGILLHRHDAGKMREAGLTNLSVSIDAIDPVVHRSLRGGASLPKVQGNLERFRQNLPTVAMIFITTVTRLNIDGIPELVEFGLGMGVKSFVLREVWYYPTNTIVDHSRMPGLVLQDGQFASMREAVLARFGDKAGFFFGEEPRLRAHAAQVTADSLLLHSDDR